MWNPTCVWQALWGWIKGVEQTWTPALFYCSSVSPPTCLPSLIPSWVSGMLEIQEEFEAHLDKDNSY